jgi:hypothetical protein
MLLMALVKRFTALSHHVATGFVTLCVLVLNAVVCHTVFSFDRNHDARELLWWHGAAWLIFAVAAAAIRWVPLRAAVALIAAGGIALGAVSLLQPPRTSSDAARYVFDGIVQQSGKSPYTYMPVDEHLRHQRTDWLFPKPIEHRDAVGRLSLACPGWEPHIVWRDDRPVCTAINRPEVHTIYPGAAEGYFLLVALASPDSAQYLPMQIAGLLLVTGVTALLLWALRRNGLNPRWAVLWAWCPLVASEAVNNAHVDTLGALLALAAVVLLAGKRHVLGGLALGLSAAVKLIPAVLLPALIRRRPVRVVAGAVAAFAASYLPYVLISGTDVIGFLPGYLNEEGYRDGPGTRFALIRLVFSEHWATPMAMAILAATAICVLWRVDARRPWTAAAAMFGAALLVATPSYPWYTLLLIPLAALAGRPEWLSVAAAPAALYLAGPLLHPSSSLLATQLCFGAAAMIVLSASGLRVWLVRGAAAAGVNLPSGVAAVEVSKLSEATLPQDREGVRGTDAVLAVQDRGLLGRQRRNQLGYALLGTAGAALLFRALCRRRDAAQRN